jgi:hypothetical protein
MKPLASALAVMVWVFRLKVPVAEALLVMVTEQVREVPVQAPDHPAKVELTLGVAVKVTTVPALKLFPVGMLAIDPVPVPFLLRVSVYWGALFWVTVNVFPPTVTVPVLIDAPELTEAEKFTLPLPLPLLPPVMEIQLALLDAFQEHPLGAVTAMVPLPPLESKDWLVGEIA